MIKMSNFNNLDFYQLFEIDKNFNETELKKAYYRLSLKYHPDKNSKMEDMFKYINRAYEILNSPQKKKVYDEFGISAFNGTEIKREYKQFNNIKHNIPHKKLNDFEVSVFDDLNENSLFRYDESSDDELSSDVLNYSYLSNGEKFALEEKPNKEKSNGEKFILKEEKNDKDIVPKTSNIKIDVTLEELYAGVEKQVKIERKIICPECFGKHNYMVCDSCLGNGYTYNINLEKEVVCISCSGEGKKRVEKKDQCVCCHGKITINETKTLIAHILPGMKHNEKIIFKGEGDQSLQSPPNDIVALINVLPHPQFTISGNDLVINVTISLKESLCGLRRRIKFIDGSFLSIMTNPGEVIAPNSVKLYKNKGLIKNVGSKEKGNLKIKFFVQFPENNWTSIENIKILERVLSKKPIKNSKYIPIEELAKEDIDINLNEYPSPVSVKSSLSNNSTSDKLPISPSGRITPSGRLSPASIKSSISLVSANKLSPSKKSPIDQFYLCDINSGRNKTPRTISIAEPSLDAENNPPRTVSVIDSLIMPVKGEEIYNSSNSFTSDDLYRGDRSDTERTFYRSDTEVTAYKSDVERSSEKAIEKRSPSVRSLKRRESFKRTFYSDDEGFKNIKVISPKSLKSPKELELIDKNKNVISNSRNDVSPPPIPPFPKHQRQLSNTRNMSIERSYERSIIKVKKINPNQFHSQSRPKLSHSHSFNVKEQSPTPSPCPSPTPQNYNIRMTRTIDRVPNSYIKYNM